MARPKFKITCGDFSMIKYAWNSSLRAIEKEVSKIAESQGQKFALIDESSVKETKWDYCSGFRLWQGENGETYKFDIEKLK